MDDKTRITEVRAAGRSRLADGQACLVLIYPAGPLLGRRYELDLPEITIGRGTDCDVQVDRDSVSRKHARIERRDASWVVVDLGSTNGTYVNDEPVAGQPLRDGDQLRIGNAIFKFLTGGNIESAYHEEIYQMTIVDGLTRVYNKRYFSEHAERELARTGRSHRPLSLVLFDLDHFKKVNDTYGHLTGDHVLRELAGRVKARVRREEVFARYGGEEFAVLLPETPRDSALIFAEHIRQLVEAEPVHFEGDTIAVTVSIGVSTVDQEVALEELVRQADENLYRAKNGGRNRIVG